MTAATDDIAKVGWRRVAVLVPLGVFLALAALFFVGLRSGDPSILPSALVGHPAPDTVLPPISGLERDGQAVPGLDPASFKGAVTVINVWASWCVPCHDEAPVLMQLAQDKRFRLVGINYKDDAGQRAAFSRPLRRSVRRGRRRCERPRRDRMGRLWRAGDVHRRPRRAHRL